MTVGELLDRPEKWIQGAFALDKHGAVYPPWAPNACCWCLVGAVQHCYRTIGEFTAAVVKLAEALTPGVTYFESQSDEDWFANKPTAGSAERMLSEWNDTPGRTFDEVRALVDRAVV